MGRIMADVDSQANPLRQEKGTRFNSSTQRVHVSFHATLCHCRSWIDNLRSCCSRLCCFRRVLEIGGAAVRVDGERRARVRHVCTMYIQCSIVLEGDSDCVFDLQTEETRVRVARVAS